MDIKAIETRYKGYRFRSRLEARWAVYFDTIGLEWDYELEGFELPSGRYLPDFWLRGVNMWAEVKAGWLGDREIQLLRELATATQRECLMLCGTPDAIPYVSIESYWMFDEPSEGAAYKFKRYALVIEDPGEFVRLTCDIGRMKCPEIVRAVAAARAARF